ncbi:AAA domain-containing protein [Azospirillum brasilense]|nr:AAA domain-containing protein [Azospirillum brasilense]
MTRLDPSLYIERIKVHKNGKVALDLSFHAGLNIIYGQNSSGKSTILDFLFYVIGGDTPSWQPEAENCDEVVCAIELNGEPVVLRRIIAKKQTERPPIAIFWGTLSESEQSGPLKWQKYPYSRSRDKESYSQVLFRALGIPDLPLDDGSNLTFHQMLRLVYSDQMTPPDVIFRQESFDRQITKEAVGEIACGVFIPESYRTELRIRQLEAEYQEVSEELKNIFSALGHVKDGVNVMSVQSDIKKYSDELNAVSEKIKSLESSEPSSDVTIVNDNRASTGKSLKKLIENESTKKVELEARREFLQFDLNDMKSFIRTIEANYDALLTSDNTQEELGAVAFLYCPACLAPLSQAHSAESCCLCKNPIEVDGRQTHRLRLRRELEMQLAESRKLLKEREKDVYEVEGKIKDTEKHLRKARKEYNQIALSSDSAPNFEVKKAYERRGYLERTIEELNSRLLLAKKITELSQKKAKYKEELSSLQDKRESYRIQMFEQRARASTEISNIAKHMLNVDLDRQDTFRTAKHVGFSFSKDSLSVDGVSRFSASSTVYLKNSFMYALFEASLKDKRFMFPRIIFLDGIEDKGMEVERVHHFQKLIYERSQSYDVRHQIIVTAEKLAPDLQKSELIVGRWFSHERRSLDV